MKYRKLRHSVALIGLTLLFFSLFCVVGVKASAIEPPEPTLAHKTPIRFNFTNYPDGPIEKQWLSARGKILHMRGVSHYGEILAGDLEGTLTYVCDVNVDSETFDGTGGGTVCFSVVYGDLSGTFEGRMVVKFKSGHITGMFVCHGDGDFEGMHLKGTCEGFMFPGVYSANAVLLNPNA